MKPLVVEMQAFGPFAGRQVIDFRLLGSKTFFLIHGPTGSGKTSILDAICFALFGDSSGGDRDGRQMRSHHADAETLTEVSFDFALGTDHFRVRRIPDQVRAAKRGGGTVQQLQKAELVKLDSVDGQERERAIATGWKVVTAAVEELLGFECGQFRQVIMLPQGKFFAFLKSNSQERETILQTLFGTEMYKRIEERLNRAAAEIAQQAGELGTRRQTLLGQAQVADDAALATLHAQRTQDLATRREAEKAAASTAQKAESALAAARALATRFDEFDKAAIALKQLREQEPGWVTQRQAHRQAQIAATIQPYAQAHAEAARLLAEDASRLRKHRADAEDVAERLAKAEAALLAERQRAPELEQVLRRMLQLESLRDKVAAIDSARAANAQLATAAHGSKAELTKAEAAAKLAVDAHGKLATEVQAQQARSGAAAGLKATATLLEQRWTQLTGLEKAVVECGNAAELAQAFSKNLDRAQTGAAAARQVRQKVHAAWVAGQAARLAAELVAGQPCPVCGSLEHPAQAQALGELVLDEALQAADDALVQADERSRQAAVQQAEARQQLAHLESRISELKLGLLGVEGTAQHLKARLDAAAADWKAAEVAAAGLKALAFRLTAAELTRSQADAHAKQATEQSASVQARLLQSDAVLKERLADIPAELADGERLQSALVASQQARDAMKIALDAASTAAQQASADRANVQALIQAAEDTEKRLTLQRDEKAADLSARLQAAGFVDTPAYEAARMDEAAMRSIEGALQAFDANLAAAVQRSERAAADMQGLSRPEVQALNAQHEEGKLAHLAASNAVRDALALLEAADRLLESLQAIAAQYEALQARYAVVRKVADLANGTGGQRMSFQRYVLSTLLEEVLVATTDRLRVMSRGRYELRRSLGQADRRTAAGLDIEVFDQYTGSTRAVNTLSGGEAFLASLALALGLSDVVQSYAGGIRLDAIFVDEGFGTLDAEALDFAIRALKDLQQAGRLVGIISHVTELREWIDARLEVKAGTAGSVAGFVV